MRYLFSSFIISLIFFGCGFKQAQDQWRYDSAGAFKNYVNYFLVDNMVLANSYLNSSIKFAKQSAHLNQLATIYLGVCALNKSVGIDDSCKKYLELSEISSSKSLESYYLMLKKQITKEQLIFLPKHYQGFAKDLIRKDYSLAFENIMTMEQISSQFIAASLIRDKLNKKQIRYLVDKASFYGYKKLVLYWLNYLYLKEDDIKQQQNIKKKLDILKT